MASAPTLTDLTGLGDEQIVVRRLDELLESHPPSSTPDAAFLATADHGMNAKSQCWDLAQFCAGKGAPIRKAVATGRDRYMKHHRGCSGAAYVYLKNPQDAASFVEFRREVRAAELLSASMEQLLKELRFTGKLSVVVQNGRVLKSGYEEGYFRQAEQ